MHKAIESLKRIKSKISKDFDTIENLEDFWIFDFIHRMFVHEGYNETLLILRASKGMIERFNYYLDSEICRLERENTANDPDLDKENKSRKKLWEEK